MKKAVLSLLLTLAILLSSCAVQTETAEQSTEKAPDETEEIMHDGEYPIGKTTIGGAELSEFCVIMPQTRTMNTASRELISLIARATGFTLQRKAPAGFKGHAIVLGETELDTDKVIAARKNLNDDGYALIFDEGMLFITGKTERGTLNGVYSFLEDFFGYRFLAADTVMIDRANLVEVPSDLDHSYNPILAYRDSFWYNTISDPQLSARLKINSGFGRNLDIYGGAVNYAGGLNVHTIGNLSNTSSAVNQQPCLTNEAIYQTVLKRVRELLRADPTAKIISVSQNDSDAMGVGCQCVNCKAIDDREGTPMGSLLTFVNRLAREIAEEFPDVYVDTLAYRYTRKAPKTLKPEPNVIIRLCSIECCFCHPLTDETCPNNKAFREDIEEWSKICNNLYIWDYTTDFMHYIAPFPNLHVLYDNVRFYVEHNVRGLFEQGNYQSVSAEFGELRAYLLAKLLWNPDMTREEYFSLMDGFLKDYYGSGWEYIREYIDYTSAVTAEHTHLTIYLHPTDIFPTRKASGQKDKEVTAKMVELWQKAYDAAETDFHRDHVKKSSLQAEYTDLYAFYEKQSERNRALYDDLIRFGVTSHREGTNLPADPQEKKGPSGW